MSFLRKLLLILPFSILFIHCKDDPNKIDDDSTTDTDTTEKVTSKPTSYYVHLTGTIKDIPITMNLVRSHSIQTASSEPSLEYSGFYYYDKYMEPISISQLSIDSSDMIQLVEWSSDETTNQFMGDFDEGNNFVGEWQNGYRQYSLPVNLSESYNEGNIKLDYFSWEDFQPADPNKPTENGISYELTTFWPSDDNLFLKAEILKLINGETNQPSIKKPKDIFEFNKTGLLEDYDLMVEDFKADSIPVPMFSYDNDMCVIWNEDSLLVLSYLYYSYEGGAHGNFGKDHVNLDLRSKSKLQLEDVFEDGFEEKIASALEKALRRKYDLRPSDDIREIVDVDKIPVTDNFYLTGGGIGFYYPPYELGPWAAGDFDFFVRYEDIEELLKPSFLDRF
ncbi:MAG: DUF3298 and DUF4163 domain-containing protein [Bacteroidetes bacterium]|jgi:hypothetical protein|nr:DUF3298 and DUF4163 domain-containing protein [Bacteroidota bacterium]MDF1868123.1 DUF3298 domain-containing protein [Saprospiraceae bacterium]